MRSYPFKENPISSAVSEILRYRQKAHRQTHILLLYYKDIIQRKNIHYLYSKSESSNISVVIFDILYFSGHTAQSKVINNPGCQPSLLLHSQIFADFLKLKLADLFFLQFLLFCKLKLVVETYVNTQFNKLTNQKIPQSC